MQEKNNLTEGNVIKVLVTFSIPFLIANLIQALYGAVDLLIIGAYCSTESVAAVSTGTQVTQIITSLVSGLTFGSTILVGKYIGMQSQEDAKKVIGTTLTLFIFVSLILTVGFIALVEPILYLLKTPAESFELAKDYVVGCSLGIFFICGYNSISAILRGYGDSKRPMLFVFLACILNVAGDILFVKYFNWGVKGVAFATVLAQAVSMVCVIVYLNRKKFIFTFKLENLKIDREKAMELMRVGIPISLQECMVRLSFLYLTSMTNSLGVSAAAAVGIAADTIIFAMLPASSFSSALATITAQNFGAGKRDRVKTSLIAAIGIAMCAASAFFLWAQISPESMIGIFENDAAVIEVGVPFFRACSWDYLGVVFLFCLNAYLNGRSETVLTMISCCFGALCLRMPLIYLVSTYLPDNMLALGAVAPIVTWFMVAYSSVFVWWKMKKDNKAGQ